MSIIIIYTKTMKSCNICKQKISIGSSLCNDCKMIKSFVSIHGKDTILKIIKNYNPKKINNELTFRQPQLPMYPSAPHSTL